MIKHPTGQLAELHLKVLLQKNNIIMSRNSLFFTSILIGLVFVLFSCNNTWEEPEFVIPEYTGRPANKTIADIKAMHDLGTDTPDSICNSNEYFIVDAWVVSSDEGGNFYKSMVIQDETGAIEIEIDKTGLYNDYPVGQKIYLNCKGLLVGDYHNMYQIGWIYQGAVGRINSMFLDNYISKDGLPDLENMPQPTLITGSADLSAENVSKLVKIENCQFAEESVGKPLSSSDVITEHEITVNGASIIVRTSNYAKFRSILCPSGTGTLYGILTVYNSTYQMMLRTAEDIQFDNTQPEPEELIYNMTFDANSLTSGGWSLSDPESQTAWYFTTDLSNNNIMFHNPTSAVCDDWLISPEITLADLDGVVLYLDHKMTLQGLQDFFRVYYSTTYQGGDFNENDWTAFNPNLSLFPSSDYGLSNALDVSTIPATSFRIAIRYNNSTGIQAARWSVRSLKFYK